MKDVYAQRRLGAWLFDLIPGWRSAAELDIAQLSGGSSASTYSITSGERCVVLRMAQFPPRPDSARALAREARVLKALAGTHIPHPRLYGYCEDPDVIGSAFLVTHFVEGWTGGGNPPQELQDDESTQGLAYALMDALADLHRVDYRAVGLEAFGRPDGFLQRQADQWLRLFVQHRSDAGKPWRELPEVPKISAWLRENMPADSEGSLIHCDASFSNVMFKSDPPPRVAALIDWEIATIGNPLVDLGRAIYPFPDARGLPGVSMMKDHGTGPTRQSLACRYAERRGVSIHSLDYFMVLAMFKLAALIEPNYARATMGHDETGFSMRVAAFVPQLLQGACAIIGLEHLGEHVA